MPNHITNILWINGTPSQVEEVRAAISGTGGDEGGRVYPIDFNRLIPMPPELDIKAGLEASVAMHEAGMERGFDPGHRNGFEDDIYEKCRENIRRHGHPTWYEWHIAHWGTKWCAYDQKEIEPNIIQFDTAWSCPIPVLEHISRAFPEVEIVVEYADEDIGHNCGRLTFKNGLTKSELPHGKDADRFGYRIKGWTQKEIEEHEAEVAKDN